MKYEKNQIQCFIWYKWVTNNDVIWIKNIIAGLASLLGSWVSKIIGSCESDFFPGNRQI